MPFHDDFTQAMGLDVLALAAAAAPRSEDDWGSERQVVAENAFFAAVEQILPRRQYAELTDYCLKARSEEMLLEALRLVDLAIQN